MAKNRYKRRPAAANVKQPALLGRLWQMIGCSMFLALLSFIFMFGHDFLTQCDFFDAKRIEVDGLTRLTVPEIVDQGQLRIGTNILAVNLRLVRKRLIAHRWVAEAQVRRELPDAIAVHIREHRPLAVLDLGKQFLINTDGEIFNTATVADIDRLPLISGLTVGDLNVDGQPVSAAFGATLSFLRMGLKVQEILPDHRFQHVHVDREIGLTLMSAENRTAIKLGFDRFETKLTVLRDLMPRLNQQRDIRDVHWIDLNNLNRIVVSPRSEPRTKGGKEV